MRLIDADALINTLQDLFDKREKDARFTGDRGVTVTWNDAIYHIKTAPTIETDRSLWFRIGETCVDESKGHPIAWECDACGAVVYCKTRFCPECGQEKEV